jgi:hypothetical protein
VRQDNAYIEAPAIHEVNSWLSGRLAKVKKSKETDRSAAATKRQRTKSPQEKRQEDATVIKGNQKALFLAKYLGILFMDKDG